MQGTESKSMRVFPILAAIVVTALIYFFVFERDRLIAALTQPTASSADVAAGSDGAEEVETNVEVETDSEGRAVNVVAMKSIAQTIDSAVILRGQTQAFRQVDLRAETSGQVISQPLRKGALVEEGEVMCNLDPGTRQAMLGEARARLAEAIARVPEAEARIPEAQAVVAEARARVEEAKARLVEAEINANAATRLSESGFASETRVAGTQASVRGAEAAIGSAEAGLKSAASNLESAGAGIEAAKAGVESARAAVAAAEREIEKLTMRAPFSGLLETDTAELGSLLQPGDVCATIIQLDPIMIVGFVSETQVTRVEPGAPARAILSSGVEVTGKVSFLSRASDPTTRTFRVEVQVSNTDLALSDGQTAEIIIAAEGKHAHLLPQSALTLDNTGQLGVRIVEAGDRVGFRAVTMLRDTPEGVWLTGLEDETNVIIIGQDFVTEGVRVAASYQDPAQ